MAFIGETRTERIKTLEKQLTESSLFTPFWLKELKELGDLLELCTIEHNFGEWQPSAIHAEDGTEEYSDVVNAYSTEERRCKNPGCSVREIRPREKTLILTK